MATTILQRQEVTKGKGSRKVSERTETVNLTHNNARLLYHGGRAYEFVGLDASGNRIYRDQTRR